MYRPSSSPHISVAEDEDSIPTLILDDRVSTIPALIADQRWCVEWCRVACPIWTPERGSSAQIAFATWGRKIRPQSCLTGILNKRLHVTAIGRSKTGRWAASDPISCLIAGRPSLAPVTDFDCRSRRCSSFRGTRRSYGRWPPVTGFQTAPLRVPSLVDRQLFHDVKS